MRLSLAAKLSLAFGFVAVLASAAGLYLAVTLGTVQSSYTAVLQLSAANTDASDVQYNVQGQQSSARGSLLYKNSALAQNFTSYSKTADQRIDDMKSHLAGSTVVDETDRTKITELKSLNAKYADLSNSVFALAAAGKYEEATAKFKQEGPPIASRMDTLANELSDKVAKETLDRVAAIEKQVAATRTVGYAVVVLGLAAGIAIGLFLARSISRPVKQVADNARLLGNGDLTVPELQIKSQDEVGEMANAFNVMARNLRVLIQGVSANARSVADSSQQLSSAAEQAADAAQGAAQAVNEVAGGASEQSRFADDVRHTMDELQQTIQQVASGAGSSAGEVSRASGMLAQMVSALESMARNAAGVAEGTGEAAHSAKNGSEVVGPHARWHGADSAGRGGFLGQDQGAGTTLASDR